MANTPANQPASKAPFHLKEPGPSVTQILIATAGTLLIGVLYYVLPDSIRLGPPWLLLVLLALLAIPPAVWVLVRRQRMPYRTARTLAIALLVVLTVALIGSVEQLLRFLPNATAAQLLRPGALLWISNILVFAVWYWETDGGGPGKRHHRGHRAVDFQFPQQADGNTTHWASGFVDYLFLAFCTATAFSPTDTMPLTHRAKLLMMIQSVISLLILGVLIARTVNII
ncbi:MAG: hypothetical protein OJF49_002539 [Ktedonobacterales bacterium]|jgi:uncharacterized membrane protein|nr:MAG: hypothetical protein OJF49_002539 [Ktedonobacterales bacterium]